MIESRTVTFDDAFVKRFGPTVAEFIPGAKVVDSAEAIYMVTPVFVEIPVPLNGREQCVEAQVPTVIGGKRIDFSLRLKNQGIFVDMPDDEVGVISTVEELKP